jgi:hypothetical protein
MASLEQRADQLETGPNQSTPPSQEADTVAADEPRSRESTNRIMRIAGWATLISGGVMTITGIGLLGASGSVHDEFTTRQAEGASESELQTLADQGHSLQVSGGVLLGLGLAILTAGVVLTVLEWWRRRRGATSTWWPTQLAGVNVVRRT